MPGLVQQDPLILQLHAECGIREHINIRPGEKNSVFGFAEVMMDCGQFVIRDAGSPKGVFVNHSLISGQALLRNGDILSFDPGEGLATFTVSLINRVG
ncbi:hypothetical protein FIBSPDRAFT_962303 [Athelia psychrophila]|uniref:FHA domain-containing protein n=1 Tax=Athelia psychrophila TaxID=1759441 RepID=A0A166ABB0_9AGAM|nr:hypothetical protein FIBSPDRAFT_962303 [Fibularhizoctonia sp. CBS 109695]